jgi:ribosomal protein S8
MRAYMSEQQDKERLRKRILEEMTADYSRVLEQDLDLAKQLVRLAENGSVDVLFKEKVTGQEKILLYLIGKLYAREAGLVTTDEVGNNELMENLAIPSGSLLPWLKNLRDGNRIKQTEREHHTYHSIPISQVDKTLKEIMQKLQGYAQPSGGVPSTVEGPSLPESLAEFVKSKGVPTKHSVLAVVFGYWLFNKKNQKSFNVKDIKGCYDDARIPESRNTSQYLNLAQSEGYLKRLDEKKDNRISWTITQSGEKFVEEGQWKTDE